MSRSAPSSQCGPAHLDPTVGRDPDQERLANHPTLDGVAGGVSFGPHAPRRGAVPLPSLLVARLVYPARYGLTVGPIPPRALNQGWQRIRALPGLSLLIHVP